MVRIQDGASGGVLARINEHKLVFIHFSGECRAHFFDARFGQVVIIRGGGVLLINYTATHGAGENIFLVTQYFVNGYLRKEDYPFFDGDMSDIRKGMAYTYNLTETWVDKKGTSFIGTLSINGRKYRLP